VLFRADTFDHAWRVLAAMAGLGAGRPATHTWAWYVTPEVFAVFVAGVVGALPVVPALARRLGGARGPAGQVRWAWLPSALATATLVVLLVGAIAAGAAHTYNPFIYFRF
jgi:hypothetical protein